MRSTEPRIERFLAGAGRTGDTWHTMPGDASARRYARLSHPDRPTVILMDAGLEGLDEVTRFARIARHLRAAGLSAPDILAEAPEAGLLLVEDLGPGMFDRIADADPAGIGEMYRCAAAALVVVQAAPAPEGLECPNAMDLAALIRPAFDWYRRVLCGRDGADASGAVISALAEAIDRHAGADRVLCLRDFHAGNLVWLPDRDGPARAGLLDFQDAFLGPVAYDLISLLRDVRRDVPIEVQSQVTRRFADQTGTALSDLQAASAVLAVQRNLRILGVFARLARRDGKTAYLSHLPRVWRLLVEDLAHPALDDVRGPVLADLPAPDAEPAVGP